MIKKEKHFLLTSSSEPVQRDGLGTYADGETIVVNEYATNGNLYVDVCDFDTAGAAAVYFCSKLYYSHNGNSWYLGTSLPHITTCDPMCYHLTDVGRFIKMTYKSSATSVNKARFVLELNNEL